MPEVGIEFDLHEHWKEQSRLTTKHMKHLFVILLGLFYTLPSVANKKPVKLDVRIDNSLTEEPQWVYWISLIGNEFNFIDSVYLEKGSSSFELEHTFSEDKEFFNTWLTFAKKGPSQSVLQVNAGDNLTVYIDESTGLFPRGKGNFSIEEYYANIQETNFLSKEIERMQDSLVLATNETTVKKIESALDSLNNYLNVGIRLKFMENSRSSNVYLGYLNVVDDYLNEVEMGELIAVMKNRFPNSKEVQMYPERKKYPVESEHSKSVRKRIDAIMAEKYNVKIKKSVQPKIDSTAIAAIKAYELGDKILGLKLNGLNGEVVDLNEIQSTYILIDFWASWCGPCRKEVPYLKAALNKYPDDLSVYAISMDEDENQWRKSIKRDKSEMFMHTLLGNNTTESLAILAQFGVKAIPANFLLDKERKIIATNLRKNDLIRTMKEQELLIQ